MKEESDVVVDVGVMDERQWEREQEKGERDERTNEQEREEDNTPLLHLTKGTTTAMMMCA